VKGGTAVKDVGTVRAFAAGAFIALGSYELLDSSSLDPTNDSTANLVSAIILLVIGLIVLMWPVIRRALGRRDE
jgi:uncharacterized membrane protein HdeD (DUF308 family)